MKRCRHWRRLIPQAIYGELFGKTRERMERHLAACPGCAGLYDAMARAVRKVDARPAPDRSPHFWEGYWDRLEARMSREAASEDAARRPFKLPAWAYGAAGAALFLALGIFLGRTFFRPQAGMPPLARTVSPGTTPGGPAPRESAVGPALDARASRYLKRSRTLLLAVINTDAQGDELFRLNLPLQKKTSEGLLQEAAVLKKGLGGSDPRLGRLISDLEMILLQIANLKPDPDVADISIIKAGVEGRDIFFQINLREVRRSAGKAGAGAARERGNSDHDKAAVSTAAPA